jgi:FkbM family methyltransferase
MPTRISRARKLILVAATVLALGCLAEIFAHTKRSATVRTYFRVEGKITERWPFERGRYAIYSLVPVLCRVGILGPARIQVEPGVSFMLDPRDLVANMILRTGEWQPEIWESISPNLSEGSVFLDVGAHIGYFSIKAAPKVGKTGRVVAFEPNPETLVLLRDNVTVNKAQNVIVEPIACTDREQTLTLYAAPNLNTGASSLARENANISAEEAPRPYSVRGRPIDDVVRELNLERVDAMKVDVEGAEVYVLRGAVNTMKRFHPKIVVEIVERQLASMHTTPHDLIGLIEGAGYNRSRQIDEFDWEWTMQDPRHMASTVRIADLSTSDQLSSGFYNLEGGSWRWTAGRFAIALRTPPGAPTKGATLVLKLATPEVSLNQLKSITLSAKVREAVLAPETFTTAGEHAYRRDLPASAFDKDIVNVDFSLDKVLPPGKTDPRELGVVVTFAGLEPK